MVVTFFSKYGYWASKFVLQILSTYENRSSMSQTSSLLLLLPIAIMMAKVMTIIMVLIVMIMITIKIMNVEYIWRISLNAMRIKVSFAVPYDINRLI